MLQEVPCDRFFFFQAHGHVMAPNAEHSDCGVFSIWNEMLETTWSLSWGLVDVASVQRNGTCWRLCHDYT